MSYTAPGRRDMRRARSAALFLCAAVLALVPATEGRSSIEVSARESRSIIATLQSIAAWLEKSGQHGWMGADVADALDILRLETEKSLAARQRAYRSGNTLHLAQIPVDERREFLLFMVKKPDERVYFYLSTVSEGYKRSFVAIPAGGGVMTLDPADGERGFREEMAYWEGVIAGR